VLLLSSVRKNAFVMTGETGENPVLTRNRESFGISRNACQNEDSKSNRRGLRVESSRALLVVALGSQAKRILRCQS
jgi:hypothetical protein